MAVVADLTTALPYLSGANVYAWEVGVTFTNGADGDADYYVSEFFTQVEYDNDYYGFDLNPTSSWTTQAQLTALCPMNHWNAVFVEQITSATTPPGDLTADTGDSVPA